MAISNEPVQSLAMEDFCQLDLRLTQDKYRGSYERCAKMITRHSSRPGLDLSELYLRLVFCYLVGNSDMHLKNSSLLETDVGSGEYALSPAYDLLPVKVIMPEDIEETALTLNGKKRNIRRKDFWRLLRTAGLTRRLPAECWSKWFRSHPVWQRWQRIPSYQLRLSKVLYR